MSLPAFRCSRWEDEDYIISALAPTDAPWRDTPLGHTVRKSEGEAIARWLNGLPANELLALAELFPILAAEREGRAGSPAGSE